MNFLWIILGVGTFLGLAMAYFRLLELLLKENHQANEIHFARASDGLRIALYRYLPQGESKGEPIIFCHGLGADYHNFDLNETYSWARKFASLGFDSWVLDLRGFGFSEVPKKWKWFFDDHILDAKAAVEHIQKTTGAEKINWIGHSMGGMILYAYLATHGNESIRSGVLLGPPIRFFSAKGYRLSIRLAWLLNFMFLVPLETVVRLLIPYTFLLHILPRPFYRMIPNGIMPLNPANVYLKDLKNIAYNSVKSPSAKIFLQFADWVKNDCFRSVDGKIDYHQGMKNIQVPILLFSGSNDMVALKENVQYAIELIPSEYLHHIELGKAFGFSDDYGHGDMVFGKKAMEEVFPLALDWVNKNIPVENTIQ